MGLFDKFSMKKDTSLQIDKPAESPIIGLASTYKTLAVFDLDMESPKYNGDIPDATIKFYDIFS